MKKLSQFGITIICLAVAGCASKEEMTLSAMDDLRAFPDKHICGVQMDLEYFTGERKFNLSSDVRAAKRLVIARRIDCSQFYDDLISANAQGLSAWNSRRSGGVSVTQSNSSGDLSKNIEYDRLKREERQRETNCIMKGGVMIGSSCSK